MKELVEVWGLQVCGSWAALLLWVLFSFLLQSLCNNFTFFFKKKSNVFPNVLIHWLKREKEKPQRRERRKCWKSWLNLGPMDLQVVRCITMLMNYLLHNWINESGVQEVQPQLFSLIQGYVYIWKIFADIDDLQFKR